jgi:antitoxin HicB
MDMPKTPDEYLKEPYGRLLLRDSPDVFSAEIPEFPGCFAQGATADEAYQNLEEAAKSWIEVSLAEGHEIPPPMASHGYSGRYLLRLPRSLHRLAAIKAARDSMSLNQGIANAVAAWVGADDLYNRVAEKLTNLAKVQAIQSSTVINVYGGNVRNFERLNLLEVADTPSNFRQMSLQEGGNLYG